MDVVEFPPEIVRKLESRRVHEGDKVQLACTIRNQDLPYRVQWYKGLKKLNENDSSTRFVIGVKQKAGIHLMTILKCRKEDEDLYRCKAIGNEESASTSCYLLVDSVDKRSRTSSLSPVREKMMPILNSMKRSVTPHILERVAECEESQELLEDDDNQLSPPQLAPSLVEEQETRSRHPQQPVKDNIEGSFDDNLGARRQDFGDNLRDDPGSDGTDRNMRPSQPQLNQRLVAHSCSPSSANGSHQQTLSSSDMRLLDQRQNDQRANYKSSYHLTFETGQIENERSGHKPKLLFRTTTNNSYDGDYSNDETCDDRTDSEINELIVSGDHCIILKVVTNFYASW